VTVIPLKNRFIDFFFSILYELKALVRIILILVNYLSLTSTLTIKYDLLIRIEPHFNKFYPSIYSFIKCTVILSFLKRERERTVNVILQSFLTVYFVQYDRFRTNSRKRSSLRERTVNVFDNVNERVTVLKSYFHW
jgi:hypothetical protein